jgi:hypothetical protein
MADALRDALERAIGFQYDILGLLGRGGMGAVYHAHEKALDRPVAIKVLPPDAVGGDARERFLREARTAARLTHPNIVPLFTFGETQGLVYYVMGYVDGESLEQRIRRGPLDAESAKQLLTQLANALHYAHGQGIVHRDVKPDNVLIERGTGVAKLTDFGIAKRSTGGETLTGTGLLMGTPKYMSPEQAAGDRELDARSDIYALGLVGYAMLTGRPPFDGSSVQEILTQQVTREAPSLRKLLPDLDSSLVTTIDRALKKNSAERWESGAAMSDALAADLDDELPQTATGSAYRPGTYVLANMIIFPITANLVFIAGVVSNMPGLHWFLPLLGAGSAIDYASMRWRLKKTPTEIRRIMTEPPRWWRLWWPARCRRRDDIWHRLPPVLRETRIWATIGTTSFFVMLQLLVIAFAVKEKSPVFPVVMGLALPLVPLPLYAIVRNIVRLYAWSKTQGIPYAQAEVLGTTATAQPSLWKQSWAARFLSTHAPAASIEPASPAAIARDVAIARAQLPPVLREHVSDADSAAIALANAIDALDTEIASLSRSFDQAEVERLESRLAAMGSARANDADGPREMRQLYASQLDLLKRLARQSQELSERRARYVKLLRTLWRQLHALRADSTIEDVKLQDLTARIRHIADSVARDVAPSTPAREAVRT